MAWPSGQRRVSVIMLNVVEQEMLELPKIIRQRASSAYFISRIQCKHHEGLHPNVKIVSRLKASSHFN